MLKYQVVIIHTARILYKRHGEYHRINGPAYCWKGGDMLWYQYGTYHRNDGPAGTWQNVIKGEYYTMQGEYYIRGKKRVDV